MDENEFKSTNINSLWLENIYENLKNLEQLERLAREGCSSLFDYFQTSETQRRIVFADLQYKNLRFIVTEINLLLTDLTPVIEKNKLEYFRIAIRKVEEAINERKLFINEKFSATRNGIISSNVTNFFHETLNYLTEMRIKIIKEIAPILYVQDERKKDKERKISNLER